MPHLVIFAGGSGSRAITMALIRLGFEVTRVTPAWDSGGSSKVIRDALQILSIGDIRHALMTIAHGEGRVDNVVRIFNTRLSDVGDRSSLEQELEFYIAGLHPSLKAMDTGLRETVIHYLRMFKSHIGLGFDLRGGSLGNFVLAGAYLAHGNDINAAITAFRRLCSIRGNVWPASTDNHIQLRAELKNGEQVYGQDRITSLDKIRSRIGIQDVSLVRVVAGTALPGEVIDPNPHILKAIETADGVVFGPGSFYTSVLPHVLVNGIPRAIAARQDIPKIFVGNMLECPETLGLTLNSMLKQFISRCRVGSSSHDDAPDSFITHVLANQSPTPFPRSANGRRYISFDSLDPTEHTGLRVVTMDFEDTWHRGLHDSSLVAAAITRLMSSVCVS